MNTKIVTPIGHINDSHNNTLLKMWQVTVSEGKRPLNKHLHLNFEIMMVISGSGIYTTASGSYPITPGDMFIFSSNEWHCITEVGETELCITNLQFTPAFVRTDCFASLTSSILNFDFCFYHNPDFLNRIPTSDALQLKSLFTSIQTELTDQQPEYALSVKSILSLLLIDLIRNHNYAKNEIIANTEQLLTIRQTLSYIDDHFTQKITLQELSTLVGLTPNYFSFLFKQVIGLTLSDYIRFKRIGKAIHLLTQEHCLMNIIDIATDCGYNNTANFNKAFKKTTSMTPSEYRTSLYTMIS